MLSRISARDGGRLLHSLRADQRAQIILNYGDLLRGNMTQLLDANRIDIELAKKNSELRNYILLGFSNKTAQ